MNLNIIKLLNADLPTNSLKKLSLVGESKSEMQTWVASLSMLNVGETAKQLFTTLQELQTAMKSRGEILALNIRRGDATLYLVLR